MNITLFGRRSLSVARSASRFSQSFARPHSSLTVIEQVNKLARKGSSSLQTGDQLRDSHGILQVRFVTDTKILRILKPNGSFLLNCACFIYKCALSGMSAEKENIPASRAGDNAGAPLPLPPKKQKASYSQKDQEDLVASLLATAEAGRDSNKSFKIAVWNEVADKLNGNKMKGADKTATGCQDHFNCTVHEFHSLLLIRMVFSSDLQLRTKYRLYKELREKSGPGWDDAKQTVTGDIDFWDRLVSHPPRCSCLH